MKAPLLRHIQSVIWFIWDNKKRKWKLFLLQFYTHIYIMRCIKMYEMIKREQIEQKWSERCEQCNLHPG